MLNSILSVTGWLVTLFDTSSLSTSQQSTGHVMWG
jgi:hypothetical protein